MTTATTTIPQQAIDAAMRCYADEMSDDRELAERAIRAVLEAAAPYIIARCQMKAGRLAIDLASAQLTNERLREHLTALEARNAQLRAELDEA